MHQDSLERPHLGLMLPAVLAIAANISMSRGFLIRLTTPGLDPSFIFAYNYAAAHGLPWGRDFISTYGPYGYLLLTMDVGHLVVSKVVWTLLLEISLGLASVLYLWSVPQLRTGGRFALLAGLVYACLVLSSEYQWFALVVLLVLIGVHDSTWKGSFAYWVAGLLAGFCALMKLSLGAGALLTLAVSCVLTRRAASVAGRAALAVCGAAIGFLAGWLAYSGRISDIWLFFTTGLEVSRGYSSAMSKAASNSWIGAVSFVTWLLLLVMWVKVQGGQRTMRTLAVLAMPLFVAWKHGIVRQDGHHVRILIEFGAFAMVVLLIEILAVRRWRLAIPVFLILFIPLVILEYTLPSGWRRSVLPYSGRPCATEYLLQRFLHPLKFCGVRDLVALHGPAAYRDRLAAESKVALREDVLPESMRAIVGSAPVDVYPWEIAYIPANGLSWANRPLPASFNAYTPLLDDLNAAFFDSDSRPRYLLWHSSRGSDAALLSIDGRHLFWDEPRTLRTILDWYDLREGGRNITLLRARALPRFAPMRSLGTVSAAWNAWIPVPRAPGVLLAHASIERSATMLVIRAAFREEAVYLSLRFSSGEEVRYRFVPDNASQGLWLGPFPKSMAELQNLLRSGAGRRIVAIRFGAGRLVRLYEPITVSWAQLIPLDGRWTEEP